jgi:HD-GYP domain-containing protein (c-di-GMP phosphodiesterase class II)
LTSDRPYRQGQPLDEALAVLRRGAGCQWDPLIVQLMVEQVRRPVERVNRAMGQ